MSRGTFNLRLSTEERRELEMKAKLRGWPLGRYIRFRALGRDEDQNVRIEQLERSVNRLKKEVGT